MVKLKWIEHQTTQMRGGYFQNEGIAMDGASDLSRWKTSQLMEFCANRL